MGGEVRTRADGEIERGALKGIRGETMMGRGTRMKGGGGGVYGDVGMLEWTALA